jgi:spoIIIJ-associated protein
MENWESLIKKLIESMGFADFRVDFDAEHNHGSVFIYENEGLIKDNAPVIIASFNHILQLIAKKHSITPVFFDFNNYRKEREHLIAELARTAARKVAATKQEMSLPAMNSYERRLVHVELAAHPMVSTESSGAGKARYVVIRPIPER